MFVVYGRNAAARKALFEFLRAIELQPLEWEQIVQATGEAAPYVGDVLEQGFRMAQAVVVLFTPDDEARLRPECRGEHDPPFEAALTPQPRANVIFEAGMALGIHSTRTVLVEIGRLRPMSDISGRHTVRMDGSLTARQSLAQRLGMVGCAINIGGADWHSAGDFGRVLADLQHVASASDAGQIETKAQEEHRVLKAARNELDSNTELQRVIAILKAEQEGQHFPPLSGLEMRRLPSFLERIATDWEFGTVSIRAANEVVGDEVVLCDESRVLWKDEQVPRSDTYWRLFNKFAASIRDERRRRRP